MDSTETESFCSSSSSDVFPKDYSSSSPMIRKHEEIESKRTTIRSMELNFGVDRLLAKCDKIYEKKSIDENLLGSSLNENKNLSFEGLMRSKRHFLESNFLHQQFANAKNFLPPSNFILKPFPLRFGRNEDGEN